MISVVNCVNRHFDIIMETGDIEFSFDDTFEVDSDHTPSRSNSIKGKKGGLDSQRRKEKRRSKVRNKEIR